jgi:cullin-associated NEDD8-dissociated protein 1
LQLVEERHPRVASESFRVFSSLLTSLAPIKNGAWVDEVYDQALSGLSNHDTDAEVRACAEDCIGDLWIAAPDIVKGLKEWEFICRPSGKTDGAVKVVTKVAKEAPVGDDWANGCVQWLINLLQKSGRAGKAGVFGALEVLLKRFVPFLCCMCLPVLLKARSIDQLQRGRSTQPTIRPLPVIRPYITTADISLLAQGLTILSIFLELSPSTTFQQVESDLLNEASKISHSPLVSGVALEALFRSSGAWYKLITKSPRTPCRIWSSLRRRRPRLRIVRRMWRGVLLRL